MTWDAHDEAERRRVPVHRVDLPGGLRGVLVQQGERAMILLDRGLEVVERIAVLTHELVHLERGGSGDVPGMPDWLATLVEREEERVERITAERLLPASRLAAWLDGLDDDAQVSAWDVAEAFDVTLSVAQRALVADRERRRVEGCPAGCWCRSALRVVRRG